MKRRPTFRKKDYPVSKIRRYLEAGPVVLVTLGMEGKHEYHDDGLAHGLGLLSIARSLLHLECQLQLRDDPPQPGMCDQCTN